MNHYYNKNLRANARQLRNESISTAEKYIWKQLLSGGKTGVKFKRQRPIANYIVDFCSQEINLIIEIDGNSHRTKGEYDKQREDHLLELGFTLLRFSEGKVLQDISWVGEQIQHAIYCLRNS